MNRGWVRQGIAAIAMSVVMVTAGRAQAPPDPTICAGQNFPDFCFINLTLPPGAFGDAAWADFDLDGDLDLAIAYNAGALTLCYLGWVTPVVAAILMPISSIALVALTTALGCGDDKPPAEDSARVTLDADLNLTPEASDWQRFD